MSTRENVLENLTTLAAVYEVSPVELGEGSGAYSKATWYSWKDGVTPQVQTLDEIEAKIPGVSVSDLTAAPDVFRQRIASGEVVLGPFAREFVPSNSGFLSSLSSVSVKRKQGKVSGATRP